MDNQELRHEVLDTPDSCEVIVCDPSIRGPLDQYFFTHELGVASDIYHEWPTLDEAFVLLSAEDAEPFLLNLEGYLTGLSTVDVSILPSVVPFIAASESSK